MFNCLAQIESVVSGGAGLPRIQVCWLFPRTFCPPQGVRGIGYCLILSSQNECSSHFVDEETDIVTWLMLYPKCGGRGWMQAHRFLLSLCFLSQGSCLPSCALGLNLGGSLHFSASKWIQRSLPALWFSDPTVDVGWKGGTPWSNKSLQPAGLQKQIKPPSFHPSLSAVRSVHLSMNCCNRPYWVSWLTLSCFQLSQHCARPGLSCRPDSPPPHTNTWAHTCTHAHTRAHTYSDARSNSYFLMQSFQTSYSGGQHDPGSGPNLPCTYMFTKLLFSHPKFWLLQNRA